MEVRYAKKTDYIAINKWSDIEVRQDYVTLVIPGCAAASVVCTSTNQFAFLNNVIVNPHLSKKTRKHAISKIIKAAISFCDAAGVENIIGFSDNKNMEAKARDEGFVVKSSKMFIRSH